jgi:peptidoglycan/LPS O-acetylase OafA/YrhL
LVELFSISFKVIQLNLSAAHRPMAHPSYRPDIDGLRAIAVLLVVIHHAFPPSLPGGFIGVDLFFVISGFLISTIIFQNLQQGTFSFLDFYKRRVKRIFPALCLVLIASFVYGWSTLLPADYKQLGKHMAAGAAFVSNFAFWNESGYFDGGSRLKPLLHLWSLGVEEQYYIFWPLIVLLLWKRKLNLLTVCVVLFVLSFAINMVTVKNNAVAAFYSPLSRFWELLIGSMLAYTTLNAVKNKQQAISSATSNNAAAWAGALFLAIGVYFINPERRFPGFWALFPTLAAYLLIKAGPQAWFNRKVLSNRALVWVGLISFPLYLWHWPLLVFAELHEGKTPSTEIRLAMIAMGIVLAWLTYRLVERPIRFGKLVIETKKIPLALCGILLAIALLGGYTYARDGFDFRFPKVIRALTNSKIDMFEGWRLDACILQQDRPASEFSDVCVDTNKRPLVFLWGDSHAAALYPGFKKLQETGVENGGYSFGMAQRNGAICPPMLDVVSPWCKSINDDSFKLIAQLQPEIVLLNAYWLHELYDLNKLDSTVAELRRIGIKKIILLGPTPYWQNSLPHNILEVWKKGPAMQKPPLRMTYGLDERLPAIDAKMQAIAARLGIGYISGYKTLCNEAGCLTRNGEDGEIVASTDYGHLTVSASQSYIQQIAPLIFGAPK